MKKVLGVTMAAVVGAVMFAANADAATQSGSKSCPSSQFVSIDSTTYGPKAPPENYTEHYYAGASSPQFFWLNNGTSMRKVSSWSSSNTTWKVVAPTITSASAFCLAPTP